MYSHKEYLRKWRKNNLAKRKQYYKKAKEKSPWMVSYSCAKDRCNRLAKEGYKYYGGKGVKFLMTKQNFKELWFRDKAYLMDKPSIDRKNSNGNYELSNCRFIEHRDNKGKLLPRTQCKRGHLLTPDNIYISPKGHNLCKQCLQLSKLRYREKHKRSRRSDEL